jgi:FAD/FMN-containing dehydrogenase
MMEDIDEEALRLLEEIFEDRFDQRWVSVDEPNSGIPLPLASVSPISAGEVQILAELAGRYSVPLVALGAETDSEPGVREKRSILVRYDLMRKVWLRGFGETWARAQPGASWLKLDDNLHTRGWGLAVYPTSTPRATIGGWLALGGVGVGSFEYGRLHENVLSADVVLPGGEYKTVRGEDFRELVGEKTSGGIVVAATLRTRWANADMPFAATFRRVENLVGSTVEVTETGVPLWHLAFFNSELARARGLGEEHLLFGAYPRERAAKAEEGLLRVLESNRGRILPAIEAYQVWEESYFPVAPFQPTPSAGREIVSVERLPDKLGEVSNRRTRAAVQGTVARSREVLLLSFDTA